MASFIEEGVEEVDPNEVLTDISTSEPEAKAEEPVVQEQVEEDVPEKYRGKSAKEIAQMHMEAEKLIGRPGSEGGEHYWVAGHGALVGGPHRPQKALTRSGSLRLRVNALGWSGCRAMCANSSEAIRSASSSVKYCMNLQ